VNNFLTPLDVRHLGEGLWMVLAPFTYRLGHPAGAEFVHVPVGFVTDFASIPRPLWTFWPSPGGKYDKPSLIHDALYQRGYVESADGSKRIVERSEADTIFRDAMKVTKTNGVSLRLIYCGVRLGGRAAWNAYWEND